jgi:hypothetical protein
MKQNVAAWRLMAISLAQNVNNVKTMKSGIGGWRRNNEINMTSKAA